MKVLVTGGTGVVGQATVTALTEAGHTVRLLSRNAAEDSREWPVGVEPWPGNVADAGSLLGSAEGCDAVMHVVGIVNETLPDATFEKVNVGGTRSILQEAERAGVGTFVFVSSLGADRGQSDYHKSKAAAEAIVRSFKGRWVICRPGSVYGPGDEQVSMILKMVRTMPAIPLLGEGGQPFQPVWHEDLGKALAQVVEREDLAGRTLDMAGPEQTTQNDLVDRFSKITDRHPLRIPVPEFLATIGTKVASMFGVETPLNEDQLKMIGEGNIIRADQVNALETEFDIVLTPLDFGLRKLADAQPELTPADGVGDLKRKRFWADIYGTAYQANDLLTLFRRRFSKILPIEVSAEPGTPTELEQGATLTMSLPLRGNIQVRVEEITSTSVTLVTLDGHPLAGAVSFLFEQRGPAVRFEVRVHDRASTLADLVAMRTVGDFIQNANWEATVERMIAETSGTAPKGVEHEILTLDDAEAAEVQRWVDSIVMARKRDSHSAGAGASSGIETDSVELRPGA